MSCKHCAIFLHVLASAFGSVLYAHEGGTVAPHIGKITYDGQNTIAISFMWHSLPDNIWKSEKPGFELDINIPEGFFTFYRPRGVRPSCKSETDLPDAYDDCRTAGFLEPDDTWNFGIGSYSAKNIEANKWYYGKWIFRKLGKEKTTTFRVRAEESEPFVPFCHSPWCMYGTGNAEVVMHDGVLKKGEGYTRFWHFTGQWLEDELSSYDEPDGQSYESPAGIHYGKLVGPNNADFNLCLFKWIRGKWVLVDSSDSLTSREYVTYSGEPGLYIWVVYSERGSGYYNLYIEHP